MFSAYILKSEKDGRYYYGSCKNVENRLFEHNAGKVKATKNRRPFAVCYVEEYMTRSEAYKRELFFKSIEGYRWLKDQKIT
ncbi:MAG: GIY-YIG nuclease family protein [Proteobacteria bacterium]|nr:MAG: GIY-YIG nuclease family protein [Pseudomonadota bacterium]